MSLKIIYLGYTYTYIYIFIYPEYIIFHDIINNEFLSKTYNVYEIYPFLTFHSFYSSSHSRNDWTKKDEIMSVYIISTVEWWSKENIFWNSKQVTSRYQSDAHTKGSVNNTVVVKLAEDIRYMDFNNQRVLGILVGPWLNFLPYSG